MKEIPGGVCAPRGFSAAGVHCGVRRSRTKKDLALIVSEVPAAAAALYTTNLVQGAPLVLTREHLQNGVARAIVCNSGNANTCNANGLDIARGTCALVGEALGVAPEDVVVASTGVIGQPLSLEPFRAGVPALAAALDAADCAAACEAIMTTDTRPKAAAVEFTLGGRTCRLGGIAKGSGMIHPNMATMLAFLTTDAAISPAMLRQALAGDAQESFHMLSIDGDTSTNDMACILANGLAGNPEIAAEGADLAVFRQALHAVTAALCRMLAADGEGATKLLECRVTGAADAAAARAVAKSVVCSPLVKAAMFGADANWGRVLCAVGYAGVPLDAGRVAVAFRSAAGTVAVCENGAGLPFSEAEAKRVLSEPELVILVRLGDGAAAATAWGCDLSYDYVRINGDYRT